MQMYVRQKMVARLAAPLYFCGMFEKIGLAVLLGMSLWAEAQAQAPADSSQNLPQVDISSERIQTPFSQAARSLSLMTKQDIRQLPVQQVSELLGFVTGVDVRQRGPQGVQADVGIRGGSFDQTLVLLNGVKLSDPQTGHHLLNLVVTPEQIERIEVLKGPGTRIYGPNAFAGAINIITKTATEKSFNTHLSYGEYGLFQLNGTAQLPFKRVQQQISVGLQGSDGYRYNTDFRSWHAFYQMQTDRGRNHFYGMAGYNQRAFGANGFYANESFADQFEKTKTIFGAFGWKRTFGKLKSDAHAYYRQHEDDYFFIRENPAFFHNHHISRVGGVEWKGSMANRLGHLGLGAEWRSENLVSSNLGDRQRQLAGFFVEQRISGKQWQVSPGVYLNGIEGFGWRAYPGLDVAFFPVKGLNVYANLAQSFRLPTYTDLYYQSPANLGNDQLQPEQAWTYELGSRYFFGPWLVSGALFARDASRIIEWTRPTELDPWQANNFLEIFSRGAELELLYKRESGFLRQIRSGYTYIDAGFSLLNGLQSRYILENLRHQWVLALVMHAPKSILITTTARLFERVSQAERYALVDVQLSKHFGSKSQLYLQATNAFNTPYREIGTVPMPGRWLRMGLRIRI